MYTTRNESGFSAVLMAVCVVVLAIVAFTGWYLWHVSVRSTAVSSKQTSSPTKSRSGYIVIKEWGVRIPYTDSLTLTYEIKDDFVSFSVKEADDLVEGTDTSCTGYAGGISRLSPDEQAFGQTVSVKQEAKTVAAYVKAGNYYYLFEHAQAVCNGSLPSNVPEQTWARVISLMGRANADIETGVRSIQVVK